MLCLDTFTLQSNLLLFSPFHFLFRGFSLLSYYLLLPKFLSVLFQSLFVSIFLEFHEVLLMLFSLVIVDGRLHHEANVDQKKNGDCTKED